ncbi:hypothetical protein LTR78_009210 [Recurvomyces mirabilis]|uniref:Auxiliary Activity family 9 catalytic domain-containing protein n=1 Tax=Recurvomyces mirabilis TaxID=574656 RepID=A0AAE0TS69_9PEZI|nr:hypothetical protein LTR78_009210 [Recurvomyces mirabilis]KAK5155630.1 hypothetical protein LTS14_005891 [Recurvomyces mirabilis]
MHASTTAAGAVLAVIAALPAVSAHGYVASVISGGTTYAGASPQWFYSSTKPTQAGWFAYNQDNGFVAPSEYGDNNITCHKGATPGNTYVPVTAGSTISLVWNTWPDSHHGPVINQMAKCSGECTSVDKTTLKFFAVQNTGLINDASPPGTWATDNLIANKFTGTLKIPAGLAAGNYVLRHEIIALHSAGNADGAQSYPNCINLKVTGSGTETPCASGADCRAGTALYKSTDPGILISIYSAISSYTMPGPAVWSGLKKRAAWSA